MAADRVDERGVAHEPVLVDVAAEVHELVDQVHRRRRRDEEPADVGGERPAEEEGGGDRHQREDDEGVGREERHAEVVLAGEAHLGVGEELVMHQGVAGIDRAEEGHLRGAVHDVAVQPPFEEVAHQERQRHRQPLEQGDRLHVRDVDVERGQADGVDDEHVEPAVVPAGDALTIGRPVTALAFAHAAVGQFECFRVHCALPFWRSADVPPVISW